jgi:hypothetical protein
MASDIDHPYASSAARDDIIGLSKRKQKRQQKLQQHAPVPVALNCLPPSSLHPPDDQPPCAVADGKTPAVISGDPSRREWCA